MVSWTGLNATDFTSTPQNITRTIAYLPGKTLWDWLQLLIIPAVLAVAGYIINLTISRGEQEATKQRDKTEHDISLENQREKALQDYIDKMSELLLEKKLRDSAENDEVRKIARVRTLTVLRRLDAFRKTSVFQFLYESGLIDKDKCIIDLRGADLSGAYVYLSDVKLSRADLSGADLSGANLTKADLSSAKLGGANLSSANLGYALQLHFQADQHQVQEEGKQAT